MKEVVPAVLTRGRAQTATTPMHIDNCRLVVCSCEAEEYGKHWPDLPILIYPHDRYHSKPAAQRQWLIQWANDEGVHHWQLDDDIHGLNRLYTRPGAFKRNRCSPERAYDVLCQITSTCEQMGAHLCGVAEHPHPTTFRGYRPFKVGGYVLGGAMGIVHGHKMWVPTEDQVGEYLPIEDWWLSALNAYFYRYAFYDLRFAFSYESFTNPGGLAELRGGQEEFAALEARADKFLIKNFGTNVIKSRKFTGNAITKLVNKPERRHIELPYPIG